MIRWLMTLGRISSYVWLAMGWWACIALLASMVDSARSGPPAILLIMGLLQLSLISRFWPRRPLRLPHWSGTYRYPGRRSYGRPGATLTSVTVALLLITLCLTMLAQAYVHGSRAQQLLARRTAALASAQEQIETLRARGYGALAGTGGYRVQLEARSPLRTQVQIAAGPVAESKQVTVTVWWTKDERMPAGRVSLSTIMSARGIGT